MARQSFSPGWGDLPLGEMTDAELMQLEWRGHGLGAQMVGADIAVQRALLADEELNRRGVAERYT